MFEHILDCPRCGKRFHYEHEGMDFPEMIVCPECGESSESGDFEVLLLCHECHVKIKVPLSMLDDEDNRCPKCGAEIRNDRLTHLTQEGMTLTGITADGEKKRMLQDGDFFDKFQIIKLLGRGGMAEVYLAEHLLLKQKCALKLMQRTLDQDDNPVFIKRFVREAKLTHSFSHPNIVKVFDAGSDFKTGYLFLAMEYVEGQTLHDIINARELSEKELLEILNVMANALKVLESAKVVHRDIKPSNIMYTKEGVYKLMDLGIAKMESNHQAGDMTLTMEQSTIGTPGYASPEQCSSAHLVDVRSDIFSLGAALYHAATGFIPFKGDTPVAAILNTIEKTPDPIRDHRPDLSNEFIGLIEKMMKKKPSERFQNIDELIEAIGKVEQANTVPAPVRKLKKAITALGTTMFTTQKDKNKPAPSVKERIARDYLAPVRFVLNLALILVIIAVAVLHLLYVVCHLKDTALNIPYSQFMKTCVVSVLSGRKITFFTQLLSSKHVNRPPEQPTFATSELLNKAIQISHSMIPYPEKNLAPIDSPEGKKYVVAALANPLESYKFKEYSFDSSALKNKKTLPVMFRNGMADLTTEVVANMHMLRYFLHSASTISLNFMLTDTEAAGIFQNGKLDLFILNGTLRIFYKGCYTDTKIRIKPGKWMNLTLSIDSTANRLDLLSGNLLLGSYLIPAAGGVYYYYTPLFGSQILNAKMPGKIDFAAYCSKALDIVPCTPLRHELFTQSSARLPDKLFLKEAGSAPLKITAGKQLSKPGKPASLLPEFPNWERAELNYGPDKLADSLKRSRENLLRYTAAVKQWETQQLPSTLPPTVNDKRRELLSTARALITRWQMRLAYMEQRNAKIREVQKERYDKELNKELRSELNLYLIQNKLTSINNSTLLLNYPAVQEKMKKDAQKFQEAFSDSDIDPNLKIGTGTWLRLPRETLGRQLSLLTLICQYKFFYSNEMLRKLLVRYADPGTLETLPHTELLPEMIEYGLPSRYVQSAAEILFTPSRLAAQQETLLMEKLFMDGARFSAEHLSRAVKAGNHAAVRLLLACGTEVNGVDEDGETPFFKSYFHHEGEEIAQLLLAAGADPEIRSHAGKKAADFHDMRNFLKAWHKQDLAAVRKFLRSPKVSPDHLLGNGQTLLSSACAMENYDLVKLLLDHGADPNFVDNNNDFPLASPSSRLTALPKNLKAWTEIMLLLLEKGADFSLLPPAKSATLETVFDDFRATLSSFPLANRPVKGLLHTILMYYPNKNELLPRLFKHLGQIPEAQCPYILADAKDGFYGLTESNKLLLLSKVASTPFHDNAACLRSVKLTPEILQKLYDKGLSRVWARDENSKLIPLLTYLVDTQSPEVVQLALESAVKSSFNGRTSLKEWRDDKGRSLYDLAKDPEIKMLLKKYLESGTSN